MQHPNGRSSNAYARIKRFAAEHGCLELSACNRRPEVGDIAPVIVNHVCVVINMVDQRIAVRGGEIVDVLTVTAR